ncbi:MAG: hypothetical protein D6E12_15695 [Desulfovibrio sp.]|nr:MAG: hypothetical protein D6E12_15695 [Desulfovibrio sp.]
MQHGETLHTALPWDIPWWMPDHSIFFGVLYIALGVVGMGVGYVIMKGVADTWGKGNDGGH